MKFLVTGVGRIEMLRWSGRIGALFLCGFFVLGCSHGSFWSKTRGYPADGYVLPVAGKIQKENRCGSNSLAILFEAAGEPIGEEEIATAIHNPRLDGALSIDLVLYARSKGYPADFFRATVEDLSASIRRGIPSVLMLKLTSRGLWPFGKKRVELSHFVVAYGFSQLKGEIYIHSGIGPKRMSFKQLEKTWKPAGYWMMNLGVPLSEKEKVFR